MSVLTIARALARYLFPSSMTSRRRGLTVLELLIIIVVIVVAVVLLLRWRGGSDNVTPVVPAAAVTDSAGAKTPPAVASALTTRIVFLAPLDSVATAGDTLTVRLRATTESGTTVARTTVSMSVASGGGRLSAPSGVTGDDGELEVRWMLGVDPGPQVMRVSVEGDENSTTSLAITTTPRAANLP